MHSTRNSPIKLPSKFTYEQYERFREFVRKIKEIDEDRNHRGIYLQYATALSLYHSGTLNLADLRTRIKTIFKNCDVLLEAFDQVLKDLETCSRREEIVVVDPKNLDRIKDFLKTLRKKREGLREGFIEAFVRHTEHKDVTILKKEVDGVLRGYPNLREEFRMILVDHGLVEDEKRCEITREKEDELFQDDMYFHAIESAIKFAAAEDNKKPEAGVYGAIRRFYKQRRRTLPRGCLKDPKLAVRNILPDLQCEYNKLLKNRSKYLEKVRKVNESLVVFDHLS
ncbi:hypothetical protein CARUB_v10016405mg [Capsella rubella]|uniref:Uncharacterized protein n=1 Tax=Capsella rubella TaxID=81985 RepID=R0HTE0_9BRAS|nr:uncharacterized protein LOC17893678 [Capsella rubella]EOA33069.1 hypothetical protein CARUB_v10016405mg [Capsella rubella]